MWYDHVPGSGNLYGHPESSAHWWKHADAALQSMGGKEFSCLPSCYMFESSKMALSAYVDGFTLSGEESRHSGFWLEFGKRAKLEQPMPLTIVLGRSHQEVTWKGKKAYAFQAADFAQQCVERYKELTDMPVRAASTPHLEDGSFSPEDLTARGELLGSAAKIVMKLLWLARLCRPDSQVGINLLGSHVTKWSKADDRRLARLIGYLSRTTTYALHSFMHDPLESLRLSCWVDASFGDCVSTMRSCSGYFIALEAENSFLPLVWVSRKQTVTSRSTTESETVALATAVYNDVMPLEIACKLLFGREILVKCWEDNQAVLAIIKGYSSKLRHLQKTHKINIASLSEAFENPNYKLDYIVTTEQKGDILTKALGPQKWGAALDLIHVGDVPQSKHE